RHRVTRFLVVLRHAAQSDGPARVFWALPPALILAGLCLWCTAFIASAGSAPAAAAVAQLARWSLEERRMDEKVYGWWLPPDMSVHGAKIDQLMSVLHWFMLLLFIGWGVFFL